MLSALKETKEYGISRPSGSLCSNEDSEWTWPSSDPRNLSLSAVSSLISTLDISTILQWIRGKFLAVSHCTLTNTQVVTHEKFLHHVWYPVNLLCSGKNSVCFHNSLLNVYLLSFSPLPYRYFLYLPIWSLPLFYCSILTVFLIIYVYFNIFGTKQS